jgi:hypothetical protein
MVTEFGSSRNLSIENDFVRRNDMDTTTKGSSAMRFLMFVCLDTEPVDESSSSGMDIDEWVETMDARGARIIGEVLQPAGEARAVRVRNNETLVTDGPFVESKEIIAGFDIIEAADLAAAIEIAAAHPMARGGVIELRAFAQFD